MEELGSNRFEAINNPVRKKRSYTFRRPRPESQSAQEANDISSMSSTPPSDDASKVSSDENLGGENRSSTKEINLNISSPRLPLSGPEGEKTSKRSKKEDVSLEVIYGNTSGFRENIEQARGIKRSSEGVLAPANWKSGRKTKDNAESQKFMDLNSTKKSGESSASGPSGASNDGNGNENKVKKVKLKVGGVTRTIDANASSSSRTSQSSDSAFSKSKHIHKDGLDEDPRQTDKKSGLQGIPWKDFSKGGFTLGKEDSAIGRSLNKNRSGKQGGEKSDQVRKSRRVPKKRVLDGAFDDDEEDDEIRYLEKLKNSKFSSASRDDDEDLGKKDRRLSKVSGEAVDGNASSRSGKEGKRKLPFEDTDYEEEEEPLSDGDTEGKRKIKQRKESIDSIGEPKREMALTTRQRALQGKDTSASAGSTIEFPNGLPPAPSRKQKEKLTDVELQLKKAEAAQRRKLQNEKAARESEAEAIRKILGQDSNRKKREEKKKKRQEELAQEKAADALKHASNTVRWIMAPSGTTVIFPKEMGLPSIFDSKPISYPPPREKCAGPSCTNPYKYRDSKSKLPLCSLQCYKAVKESNPKIDNIQPETNCPPGSVGDAVSAR